MKLKGKKTSAKDYLKLVEWDERDECFIGSAPPLIGKCCHGSDEAKVYQELCQIVAEWIAIYEKDGRPLPKPTAGKEYSGKFVLRTSPDLHRLLSLRALQAGESLNAYVVKKLETKVLGEN